MKTNLTIVISGPPGSGSSKTSLLLAKKLHLNYFSAGDLFKSYSKQRKNRALDIWNSNFGKNKEFHHKLDQYQKEKAKRGNIVICGKLSIFLLKNIADFKVWIDAPLKVRAERVARREDIPMIKAIDQIKKREEIERREWKNIYNFDYFDSKNLANLVINSSEKSIEEIVEEILNSMKNKGLIQ
jgi:cytidylate kinase